MIDWSSCESVEQEPNRVSGACVFRGIRAPVSALFENLEDGAPIGDFVDWFPGVDMKQVRDVLEHVARSAAAQAVKILLDRSAPAPLRRLLTSHAVETAYERGWSTLQNGELLVAAETGEFDVFITADSNLKYQQTRNMTIVVLSTTSQPRIEAERERIVSAVDNAAPKSYTEVVIPYLDKKGQGW